MKAGTLLFAFLSFVVGYRIEVIHLSYGEGKVSRGCLSESLPQNKELSTVRSTVFLPSSVGTQILAVSLVSTAGTAG